MLPAHPMRGPEGIVVGPVEGEVVEEDIEAPVGPVVDVVVGEFPPVVL